MVQRQRPGFRHYIKRSNLPWGVCHQKFVLVAHVFPDARGPTMCHISISFDLSNMYVRSLIIISKCHIVTWEHPTQANKYFV